jgi:mono/diheme cytochrome c family protein
MGVRGFTHAGRDARRSAAVIAISALVALSCGGSGRGGPLPAGDPARGAAVFAAAGGCGCHTPVGGPVGAGGAEIPTPFGKFFGTNITRDDATGIGRWTEAEIEAAIRRGSIRGRGVAAPVMPYYRYAGMADDDVADLIAYLRTLAPVVRPNRAHDIRVPWLGPLAFRGWRFLFGRGTGAERHAPTATVARGGYLVDHVAICGDCHTPRDPIGAPEASRYLAGAAIGPGGDPVPNITPDDATGIGDWSAGDIATLLETGFKPNFDNVQGRMAELIDGPGGGPGYARMPPADREAIGAYLRTIPPVANAVDAE